MSPEKKKKDLGEEMRQKGLEKEKRQTTKALRKTNHGNSDRDSREEKEE